jgi:hypothetical protein
MSFYNVLRSTAIPVNATKYGKPSFKDPSIIDLCDRGLHDPADIESILAQNIVYILQNFRANSRYLVAIILETQGYGYQGETIWDQLEQRIYTTAAFNCDPELNTECCYDYEIQMILIEILEKIRFTYEHLACLRQEGTMLPDESTMHFPNRTDQLMNMLSAYADQECGIGEIIQSFQGYPLTPSDHLFLQNLLSLTAHLLQKSLHLDRPALFSRIVDQVQNSYGKNNTAPEHIVEEYVFEFLKEVYFPTDDE